MPSIISVSLVALALLAPPAAAQDAPTEAQIQSCIASLAPACGPIFAAEAVRAGRQVEDAQTRGFQLQSIGLQQALMGDWAGALATVKLLEEPGLRSVLMTAIAKEQAAAGEADAALETARTAVQREKTERPLIMLARAYAKNGAPERALETAAALNAADSRVRARAGIASELAIQKDFDTAVTAARQIEDATQRAAVLAQIVDWQAKSGDIAAAKRLAATIELPAPRDTALYIIAVSEMEGGAAEAARETAAGIEGDVTRQQVWGAFAAAYAEMGQDDLALAALDHLPLGDRRNSAVAEVVTAQARRGDLPEAIAMAQTHLAPLRAVDVLLAIAREQGAAGDAALSAALALAQDITPEQDSLIAQGFVAETMARERSVAAGSALAAGIPDSAVRSRSFTVIAGYQALTGDTAGALATSWKIEDATQRLPLQTWLASRLIEAGAVDEGLALLPDILEGARGLQDPWLRGTVLRILVRCHALADETDKALALVPEVPTENGAREEALLVIAQVLAEKGQLAAARRIAERVEGHGGRYVAMKDLLDAELGQGRADEALRYVETLNDPLLRAQLFEDLAIKAAGLEAGQEFQ